MAGTLFSTRVESISTPPSMAANARAAELIRQGRDIINLTVGEPDLDTPKHVIDAAHEALNAGDTHYTPPNGTLALRQAIACKLARDNDLHYSTDEIVVGGGAKTVIYHAFAATLNRGEQVLVHSPYWVSYPDMAKLNEGEPVILAGEERYGFKLQASQLAASINEKTKWVVLNTPNNPSGAVYAEDELAALAEVLRQHPHVLILSDEIYEKFVFSGSRHLSILNVAPDLKDRTLLVNGVSKGYAMTGWRVGYAAGPKALISAMVKMLAQTSTCTSSISQTAAIAALSGDQGPVEDIRATYEVRQQLVTRLFAEIKDMPLQTPQGAFYAYPNVAALIGRTTPDGKTLHTDLEVATFFLDYADVAVVPGAAYGLSPYVRLSFATSPQLIEQAIKRMGRAVALLK